MGILDAPGVSRSTPGADLLSRAAALAMRPWYAALSNRDYAKAQAIFIGTSMTEGGPMITTGRERRWLDRLAVNLRDRFPLASPAAGSTGYIPAFYQTFYAGGTTLYGRVAPVGVTYSGSLVQPTSGIGGRSLELANAGEWIQFTFTGTGCDVLFQTRNIANSTATVSVDGAAGAALNVPTTTATAAVYQVRGLTAGSHTVRVTWGSGQVDVDGIMPFNGDESKGIHIWDGGRGSAKASDLSSVAQYRQVPAIAPGLLGFEFGYNEFFGDVPVADFKSSLLTAVSAAKTGLSAAPTCLFIIWPEPVDSTPNSTPYSAYTDAVRAAASETTNGLVVDFSTRMPKATVDTLGWVGGDQVHHSDKGAAYVADVLARVMSPV